MKRDAGQNHRMTGGGRCCGAGLDERCETATAISSPAQAERGAATVLSPARVGGSAAAPLSDVVMGHGSIKSYTKIAPMLVEFCSHNAGVMHHDLVDQHAVFLATSEEIVDTFKVTKGDAAANTTESQPLKLGVSRNAVKGFPMANGAVLYITVTDR